MIVVCHRQLVSRRSAVVVFIPTFEAEIKSFLILIYKKMFASLI